MPSQFQEIFLTENYVTLQCDATNWEGHVGHGSYSYLVYWEGGIPYQGRLLVRVPADQAHHFTKSFSRIEE